nr:hypothetical protein [uncultured Ruminococcus sp.]
MKQKSSFILKASMALILALVMLFGTVATSLAAVVDNADTGAQAEDLADTGLGSGDGIHLGIGTINTSWIDMGGNAYEFTLQSAATIYYTFSVGGGNFGRGNQVNPGSDSPETNIYYAIKDSGTPFSISLPAGTYRFRLIGIQSGGVMLEYKFWCVSGGSSSSSHGDMIIYGDFNGQNDWNSAGSRVMNFVYESNNHYYYNYYLNAGLDTTHYFKFDYKADSNSNKYFDSATDNDKEVSTDPTLKTEAANGGGNKAFKVTNPATKKIVWAQISSDTNTVKTWVSDTTFYLTGYLNGVDVGNTTYPFTETDTSGVYTCTFDSTTVTQYVTIFDGVAAYHPQTHTSGSGTQADPFKMDKTPTGDTKWMVDGALNNTIVFTWNSTTSTLSWTIGTNSATIYAKDGAINEGRKTTRVIGTTEVTAAEGVLTNVARTSVPYEDELIGGSNSTTCYTYAKATKGADITVTTTVADTYASKYYVKGWDVNGTTYGLDPVAEGTVYSATFTVPEADKVEITPIYWLKNGNVTTFFVNNFNMVPDEWGTALYYYFWGGSQVNVDDEEKYPGQPFVHEGGQYYTQVPTDVTGITLNNAAWDTIHGEKIMGLQRNGNDVTGIQQGHFQTYDYDNFAKIAAEKTNINSIYFTFKYETVKNNFENNSGSSTRSITLADFGENGNGWEDYIDPLGRPNNILGGTTVTDGGKVLYAVSNGYVRNYQGNLATEWSIYVADSSSAPTANYVTTIPSSALVLDAEADFAKNAYSSNYTPALSTYSDAWDILNGSKYNSLPVKITYEKAVFGGWSLITNDGTCPTGAGGQDESHKDLANRMDGKWDYILNTDYSTADIRIEYSNDNGATYSTDAFNAGTNQGGTTEATAFFNNTGASYVDKHEVTSNDHVPVSTTNKYKLKTVPAPSTGYQFVGWYRLDNNSETPEFITSSTEAESLMSAKATFIARYKHVTNGNLVINHNVDGEGVSTNHTVKVDIFAGDAVIGTDEPIKTFTGESVPLNSTYINSNSSYKLRVTLTAIADAGSYIANSNAVPTVACSQAAATYYKDPVYTRTGRFAASVYPQNVVTTVDTFTIASLYSGDSGEDQIFTVLNYTTTFNKLPTYTINYKYHGRQSGENYLKFTRTITLSPDEAEGKNSSGADYSGNNGTALRPTYITTESDGLINDITANAPDKNDLETQVFNKTIAWSVPASVGDSPLDVCASESDPEYTLTYSYIGANGDPVTGKTVSGFYNDLITLDGTHDTFATAAVDNEGNKFAYWADAAGNPLTGTKEYKMRLIDNVTIHPVYGNPANGWNSAIDKITRTHETSDNSDNVFTDFALRFTGFDNNGAFIHINPDHLDEYTVGVAVVYDTAGNNTTLTTDQISGSEFYKLSETTKYKTAAEMVQLLVDNNKTSARLREVSDTTYVTRYEATNSNLTNFNRIDLAVKYNYSQNYKRYYDAYAYILDKSNNSVIAVSPVKSGYLYDGKLPVGIN